MIATKTVEKLTRSVAKGTGAEITRDLKLVDNALRRTRVVAVLKQPKLSETFDSAKKLHGQDFAKAVRQCQPNDPDLQRLAATHRINIKRRRNWCCCHSGHKRDCAPVQNMTSAAGPAVNDVI